MKRLRYAVLLCAATPFAAFAYIDPNAGGWLFQLLFPLLVAIAGAWGLLKRRIAGLFRRWTGKRGGGNSGESKTDD